jgi:hypothetical protein
MWDRALSAKELSALTAPNDRSGAFGQLGQSQLQALHVVQPNNPLILDHPRKIDSLDPFKLQPWKRWVAGVQHLAMLFLRNAPQPAPF